MSHTPAPIDPNGQIRGQDRLAYAGLLPFVGLALMAWLVDMALLPMVAVALCSYAALIASFLGGVHWGVAWVRAASGATVPAGLLVWGVAPSLLAWPGILMPAHAGLVWQGALLLVCYAVDRRLYPAVGLGRWLTLRFRLSSVAALSCFIAAGAV